ncbi:MAG: ATP-binding cassette domain-containing protein [Terriglobia bacterium]
MPVVDIRELTKDYTVGFWRGRSKRALDRLNLGVESGEIFGLLGPIGAGKSTTLKILLRLIFPTSGSAQLFGAPLDDVAVHARIGYLPENPHFYDHLTGEELLNYAGDLFGLAAGDRRRRVGELLEQVGLAEARATAVGKFSKGMTQRLGIAQALINDPELVFLDEPMSGLDPLGRREVRNLILQLRALGKTVFFSTHILSDAETLCDRVAILNHGRLEGAGELRQILNVEVAATEVVLEGLGAVGLAGIARHAGSVVRTGDRTRFEIPEDGDVAAFLDAALRTGARVVSLNRVKQSLEDYFISKVENRGSGLGTRDSGVEGRDLKPEARDSERRAGSQYSAPGSAFRVLGPEPRTPNPEPRVSSFLPRVAAIALHTFKESVRDKVLYNLIVFALLLIAASILFGQISVGVEHIILVNLSLSAISVIGLVMAIFIGIGLVSKEIDRRTVHNILCKPVRRWEFIIGKYCGLLLTLTVNTAIMTAGFYAALLYQKRSLGQDDLAALEAVYLILLELALVTGIALLFSCLSTPVLSAVYTFALFVIGNFLGDMRDFGDQSSAAGVRALTHALYYLLPNFSDFNVISRAAHGERLAPALLVANSLYALLYGAVLISGAVLIFEEREL